MLKALLFDLDHTLYDYHVCHTYSLPRTLRYLAKQGGWEIARVKAAYEAARQRVHSDLAGQGASHSRLLYFQKTIESLAGRTLPGLTLKAEAHYWRTFLGVMKPMPEAIAFLKTAQSRGLKVAIVTNLTAQIQLRKIEKLGIASLVDMVVTSEEAGVEKPAAKIFQLTLEKLTLQPNETCYIGDDEETDIAGAEKCGIAAYYLHTSPPKHKETRWATDFITLTQQLFPSQSL